MPFKTGTEVLLFLLVETFPGLARNPSEKRPAVTYRSLREFCANAGPCCRPKGSQGIKIQKSSYTHGLQKLKGIVQQKLTGILMNIKW